MAVLQQAGDSGAATPEATPRPPPPVVPSTDGAPPPALLGLRHHAKHVFVFSTAGKPIFSHHGNEEDLAELMATAKAIMSVAQAQGHSLRHLR